MKKLLTLFLAIIGGLLLWAAWSGPSLTFLVFIAWIPLLLIEDQISNWKKLFGLSYLHMLTWNVLTTWWIANSTLPGALGAFFANSLIMCIPWLLFYFTKKGSANGSATPVWSFSGFPSNTSITIGN